MGSQFYMGDRDQSAPFYSSLSEERVADGRNWPFRCTLFESQD
jgi:hypothetical protein